MYYKGLLSAQPRWYCKISLNMRFIIHYHQDEGDLVVTVRHLFILVLHSPSPNDIEKYCIDKGNKTLSLLCLFRDRLRILAQRLSEKPALSWTNPKNILVFLALVMTSAGQ